MGLGKKLFAGNVCGHLVKMVISGKSPVVEEGILCTGAVRMAIREDQEGTFSSSLKIGPLSRLNVLRGPHLTLLHTALTAACCSCLSQIRGVKKRLCFLSQKEFGFKSLL